MSRLTQIIQNTFIRIAAFVSVFFRNLLNSFKKFFVFFGKLLGFSNSGYFLESEQAQSLKQQTTQPSIEAEPAKAPETPSPNRRPNPQMDYYRKMAQEVKKS